jgi:hypothetical protein
MAKKKKKPAASKGAALKASAQAKREGLLQSAGEGAGILANRAKDAVGRGAAAVGREAGEDVRAARRLYSGAKYMLGGPEPDK